MARVTIYLEISEQDFREGWDSSLGSFEDSIKARLEEIYDDHGNPRIPHVFGIDMDPEDPTEETRADLLPTEQVTHSFNLHWTNDEPLYRAVLRYARECLRRVPNMTDQTLGRNVRDQVQRWCEDGYHSDLGWAPPGLPPVVSRSVLIMMRDEVGDFSRVSEDEVGEQVREALGIES